MNTSRGEQAKPILVGVLNLTPDSFSDGGRHGDVESAVQAALAMAEAGASWIDVGGESTRPGAVAVDARTEIDRVIPVIELLASRLPPGIRISIDTYKAETAAAAITAGATIVNDVSGGQMDPEILRVGSGVTLVLGHMRGTPASMMAHAPFEDVVAEVQADLEQCIRAARKRGCKDVWWDPGIGFGKGLDENLALIRQVAAMKTALGCPVMVGVSRKRFIGELTGRPVNNRVFGTAAAVASLVWSGVDAVRVHDVPEMMDVVEVASAIATP
ncbi:MAG: dihydropteroate synthase [Deltaproteobacteria bacterium]|nr:dihydropteroate synthase [Deltaproteobacteria bacterium]